MPLFYALLFLWSPSLKNLVKNVVLSVLKLKYSASGSWCFSDPLHYMLLSVNLRASFSRCYWDSNQTSMALQTQQSTIYHLLNKEVRSILRKSPAKLFAHFASTVPRIEIPRRHQSDWCFSRFWLTSHFFFFLTTLSSECSLEMKRHPTESFLLLFKSQPSDNSRLFSLANHWSLLLSNVEMQFCDSWFSLCFWLLLVLHLAPPPIHHIYLQQSKTFYFTLQYLICKVM